MKNIIGKNIEYFRKKLTYTKKKVAKILNVDPSLITYYEQGKRVPSLGKLDQIAKVFEIPVEWLMTEHIENIQFATRSQSKENTKEAREILSFQKIVIDFVELLSKTGMPEYKYKGPQYPNKTPSESIVRDIKKILRIDDIVYYEKLKELLQSEFNIYIFEIPFENETISGITFYRDGVFCVFLNKGHTKERRLFSLAHEFGHILFHIHSESYLVSRLKSSDPVEKEVNQFANMFLISETRFNSMINKKKLHRFKKEYIQGLADFFHVSPESIFYTLAKKGLVQYNWKSYKPDTYFPKNYDKTWTYTDLPWIYVLTCYIAFKQDKISKTRFSELIFTDIRQGEEILKTLKDIIEPEEEQRKIE